MTPAQKKGYIVGDKFEVVDGLGLFANGSIVELFSDDGTQRPLFELVDGRVQGEEKRAYLFLDGVKPYGVPASYPKFDFKINLSNMANDEKEAAKEWLRKVAESRGKNMDLDNPSYKRFTRFAITDGSAVQIASNSGSRNDYHEHFNDIPELFLTFSKPTVESFSCPELEEKESTKKALQETIDTLRKQLEEAQEKLSSLKD